MSKCDFSLSDITLQGKVLAAPEALSIDQLKEGLYDMWVMRRFEETAARIYTTGKIGGFCHLCIGQEAIAVGASLAMSPSDSLITAYRAHGHALMRGLSPEQVMGELMGLSIGCSAGKGGSMHMFNKETSFYGGHGIVGAQTSLGTGLAFAHKYRGDGGVCLTFLGDGATNQGQFFESMNMASLWGLPVLYIIENNQYSMGTAVSRACAGGPLYRRGEPFGIEGCLQRADDLNTVYQTLSSLLSWIRTHQRPVLLELDTYRFKGHSMSDPGKYRTRSDRLVAILRQDFQVSEGEIEAMDRQAQDRVQLAMQVCDQSDQPNLTELYTDVTL
jgi:pyruvate dehydrogenase E1 component alpha subunit